MSFTIRPFEPADLPRLRSIAVEAFDGVSIDQAMDGALTAPEGRDWHWRKARHIDEDARRAPDGVFVVAHTGASRKAEGVIEHDEAELVAFVTSWRDEEARIGFIPNVCVAAGYRGKGIGRQLIEYVLDDFRKRGMTRARIETLAQNKAGYGLYTSLGFEEIARQVHFAMNLEQTHGESES